LLIGRAGESAVGSRGVENPGRKSREKRRAERLRDHGVRVEGGRREKENLEQ